MAIQGVIFDMDGLMFDSEKLYYQANLTAAKTMQLSFPTSFYQQFIGASDGHMMQLLIDALGERAQAKRFVNLTYQNIESALQQGKLVKKPGLDALLAYLDQQQIPKIIASSNFKSKIERFLKAVQLEHAFSQIISFDDVSRRKPAPDLFEKAHNLLGTPAAETVVLEDSLNGLLAAEAAALPCVIVPDLIKPTPTMEAKAAAIVPDLFAVRDLIKKSR